MKKKKKKYKKIEISEKDSKNFWLPDIDIKLNPINTNSWFDILESDNILENDIIVDNGTVLRSNKICIYPDQKQKEILLKWCDVYRYTYNQTIKYIRENPDTKINFIGLRKTMKNVLKSNITMWNNILNSKIPIHTLDNAIKDVCKAYKSAFSNKKNGNINKFVLKYKKMSNLRQTITLESQSFTDKYNSFCIRVLGKYIKSDEKISSSKDSKLMYNKGLNKFYLYIPKEKVKKKDKRNKNKWCSLDPGSRTFLSGYDENRVFKICNNGKNKLEPKIEKLEKIDKYVGRRKPYFKMQNKINNIIDDLHWKSINYLCKNYNHIIVGKLSTTDVVNKETSSLSKLNKKILYKLSHFKFRERLIAKCEEYNIKYDIVDESYTTKTCGKCGEINNNIKSDKIFNCDKCKIKIDRDFNGARNIIIKNQNLL